MIPITARPAAKEATAMPPLAPAESRLAEEDASWVPVGVAEAAEFAVGVTEAVKLTFGVVEAVEFAVDVGKGAPLHVTAPLMLPLMYSCRKYSQSKCLLL
jgi:hypothetical protein